jgi:hypothetical protein
MEMTRLFSAFVLLAALFVASPHMQARELPSGRNHSHAQQADAQSTKVWVNTSSGVYHCPGTRWYGATKHGEYMTEKQAQEAGNRPAYGNTCS